MNEYRTFSSRIRRCSIFERLTQLSLSHHTPCMWKLFNRLPRWGLAAMMLLLFEWWPLAAWAFPSVYLSPRIEVSFAGVIDSVDDPTGFTGESIKVGDSFSGHYSIRRADQFSEVSIALQSSAGGDGAFIRRIDYATSFIDDFQVDVGDVVMAGNFDFDVEEFDDFKPEVDVDFVGDTYSVLMTSNHAFGPSFPTHPLFRSEILLRLSDSTGQALTISDDYEAPPIPSPSLAWDQMRLNVAGCLTYTPCLAPGAGFRLSGAISSLQVVPEPSTSLLLGCGIFSLSLRRRNR